MLCVCYLIAVFMVLIAAVVVHEAVQLLKTLVLLFRLKNTHSCQILNVKCQSVCSASVCGMLFFYPCVDLKSANIPILSLGLGLGLELGLGVRENRIFNGNIF